MSLIEIRRTLSTMILPGDIAELRIFDRSNKKYCGWFDDVNKMADAALSHDDTAEGIYYTCNSCSPNMLSVASNRIIPCITASQGENIIRRRIFGLDIDPVRKPTGISSTDAEKLLAYNRAMEVREWLSEQGFTKPVVGDSGNGYHLDYFVDLPNTPEIKEVYESAYKVINKQQFPADTVDVQGFADANRIWKVYGTMARKGENMPNRPHRRSKLLEIPDTREIVSIELLQKIADMLPKDEPKTSVIVNKKGNIKAWDADKLESWLKEHGAVIERTKNNGDITRFVLKACLNNPNHEGHKEAEVHIDNNGMIGYKCHHNSCHGVSWKMVREKLDPEYKEKRETRTQKKEYKTNGAFDYIDRIIEKNPIYYDKTGQFWLWGDDSCYQQVDITEILLTILRDIADPSIIQKTFKGELLEAARLRGRDAKVKPVPNNWIHLQNGVYDIKTGEVNEATPDYLFTDPIPHKISDSEDTPTIDKLFSEWVTPEKVPLLNELAAYCLYNGYPIHRMFVLIGRGRNGKGQYRDFVVNLVGKQNRSASTLEQLINSRFETARLFNKKVCTMGEINYTLLDRTAILKMLSGGDPIPGEMKNKSPFEFVNTAKLLINTNSLPQTSDKTDAFYSRCIMVEFGGQWQLGKDIIETIPKEEYDNFLTKSLRILRELLDRGEFTNEGDIRAKEVEYERLSNPLTQFINTHYEQDINAKVAAWRMFNEYVEYCTEKGYRKPHNQRAFNDMLRVDYDLAKSLETDPDEPKIKKDGYEIDNRVNWVWIRELKRRQVKKEERKMEETKKEIVPDVPDVPDFPLLSPIEKLSDKLGTLDTSGTNDNGSHDEKVPFDTILVLPKSGTNINIPVTELKKTILEAGQQFSKNVGVINSTNIIDFSLWFCEIFKPKWSHNGESGEYTPSSIKKIATKIFKLTPVPEATV